MKAVRTVAWEWRVTMSSIRGREYNRLIAKTNPMLALDCELQGLINKGALGFQTRRDRLRIATIQKQKLQIAAGK
jgi:hypothetical protein